MTVSTDHLEPNWDIVQLLPRLRAHAFMLTGSVVDGDRILETVLQNAVTEVTKAERHASAQEWLETELFQAAATLRFSAP